MPTVLRRSSCLASLLVILLAGLANVPAGAQESDQPRSLERAPGAVQPIENRSETSAGLFIGVNEFPEDTSLRSLRYAVNDAIGLAHVFCIELKLILPQHTTLALSGKPDGETAEKSLEALRAAGVTVEQATKSKLFNLLLKSTSTPQHAEDLLIVAISSHGFEHEGVPYAMPADGIKEVLKDTGLSLVTVEAQLARSKAGKRLLFLDACREKPLADARAGGPPMSEIFRKELAQAAGQAVLASCDVGQYSWESQETKHGVFTQYVIEGLRGAATADGQGLIRMSRLADYVALQTKKWSQANVRQTQEPWFKGKEDARQIPLAVDPGLAAKLKDRIKRLRELALDEKLPMDLFNDAKALMSGAPDDERARQRRDVYEKLADGLTDTETAITAAKALSGIGPGPAPRPGPPEPTPPQPNPTPPTPGPGPPPGSTRPEIRVADVRHVKLSGKRPSGESFHSEFNRDGSTWKLSSDSAAKVDRDRLESMLGELAKLARSDSPAALSAEQQRAAGLDPPRFELVLRTADSSVITFRFGTFVDGTSSAKRNALWVEQDFCFAADSATVERLERTVEHCTVKTSPEPPPAPKVERPQDAVVGKWMLDAPKMKRMLIDRLRAAGEFVDENQIDQLIAIMGFDFDFNRNGSFSVATRTLTGLVNERGEWSYEDEEFDITVTEHNGMQMPTPVTITGEIRGGALFILFPDGSEIPLKRP